MFYGGINRKTQERTETSDYYMVREINLYVTGISSLPSVVSVVKKLVEGKKLTPRDHPVALAFSLVNDAIRHYVDDAIRHYEEGSQQLKVVTQMLTNCKERLLRHRNDLSKFKIAMVLQSDYESLAGLKFDEKTKTAEFYGVSLKMDKVRQYV